MAVEVTQHSELRAVVDLLVKLMEHQQQLTLGGPITNRTR